MNWKFYFGLLLTPFSGFSENVQRKIQDRLDLGEQVAVSIQFFVVLFMIGIWFVAPKANSGTHYFSTIPVVLIPYTPFLLLRLFLAFSRFTTTAISDLRPNLGPRVL